MVYGRSFTTMNQHYPLLCQKQKNNRWIIPGPELSIKASNTVDAMKSTAMALTATKSHHRTIMLINHYDRNEEI